MPRRHAHDVIPLHREVVAPKRSTPVRLPNATLRKREHLTEDEINKLIEAARGNRHGHRDATMILLAFRHGLRASELCDLRWDSVHFSSANLQSASRWAPRALGIDLIGFDNVMSLIGTRIWSALAPAGRDSRP
jgi:integrase